MDLLDIFLSLTALTILEVILGIDNLVFLSILTEKLPKEQRRKARHWGLTFAWVTRLILLASAVWLVQLTQPIFSIKSFSISFRDLFLIVGGLFLIAKATEEIHLEVSGEKEQLSEVKNLKQVTMRSVIIQVGLMDIIFSLDSVLTAIGLTKHFYVMATAISIAIIVMIFASETVSRFIERYATVKMLALSFLMLIGMVLIADGFSFHIPRGYIYFAMGFSLAVEALNVIRQHRRGG